MFSLYRDSGSNYKLTIKISSNIFLQGARIVQWYSAELRAGWLGSSSPARSWNFSLHHRVKTGFGAHLAFYPIGTRGSFPKGKAAGVWTWPITPSSAEV
jgi:hypothetical protein